MDTTFVIITVLFSASIYMVLYQFRSRLFGIDDSHFADQALKEKTARQEQYYERRKDGNTEFNKVTWEPLSLRFKEQINRLPFSVSKLRGKLIKAGSPMGVLEFLLLKVLSLGLAPTLAVILLGDRFPKDMLLLFSLVVGFALPELWLNSQIKRRQFSIRRDLPNVFDLLNLCVGGGLDFMLAVNRVTKDLKPSPLTFELAEVYRETQMGRTRREALKNFASRIDMPEVHSFVRTLVQADRMGTPMTEALNMQSEEMRVRRFQLGEAMALKAPIKLLFPLFAFILPVILIIVGGPIILEFMQGGGFGGL